MRMLGRNRVGLALGAIIASLAAAMPTGAVQGAQKVGSIENVRDPEDLVQLPGTRWVVASGRKPAGSDQPGHLYLIVAQTGRSQIVYPKAGADAPTHELDAACGGPPDPGNFEAHGLGLRAGVDGRSQLYVVNHAFATGDARRSSCSPSMPSETSRPSPGATASRPRPMPGSTTWSRCPTAASPPPTSWTRATLDLPRESGELF